eukprot:TRINITY_DN2886_c0_g1_i3.p2 TRINITY_DN2886_c0_g1~~TRINITY_DN2886_c0_g1_i3.p2  ORF type:complete len:100 (-),score=30.52 TRINITY_DN2886_c0_g1_i3:185-484(-)
MQGGDTALHAASQYGHLAVTTALLKGKADVNAQHKDGTTALHRASQAGHLAVVKALLEAKADVNIPGVFCKTALWWAHKGSGDDRKAIEAVLTQAGGID